jgi:molybdate transport system substrate-binding protein
MIRALAVSAMVVLLVASCGAFACACSTPVFVVRVFAASSLKTAAERLKAAYETAHREIQLTISAGSSSALRTQIEQGADADVFLSADTANAQALVDSGNTDGPASAFATNRMAIVVPEGNPGGITSAADLARADVTIIAAGEEVPITKYAAECVANLGRLPGYPADVAAAYESNVVSREDNVGAVTSKIELGEGDAAIVYVTDAMAAELPTVEIPPEANVVATYSGVVLDEAASASKAHEFLDWVRSAAGQRILADLGFLPAP